MTPIVRSLRPARPHASHHPETMSEPRHVLFPARVTLPDGTIHQPCRVATDTAGTTFAWAWIDGGPVQIGTWPALDLQRADGLDSGRPVAFVAPDGTVLDERGTGCACGHPMKSWRPSLVAPRG